MEKKGWKNMAIVFICLFVIMVAFVGAMKMIDNKKPTWAFEGVSSGIAKIKFGKKTYDYQLNNTSKDFIIGSGRYTLAVYTETDASGVILGAKGQLFDAKTGVAVDSPVSISATA